MRTITLEEHFAPPAFLNGPGHQWYGELGDQLADIGDERIAAMDAAGIDMQVLSLAAPGVEQSRPDEAVTMARDANDMLGDAVRRHPTRFGGFATMATPAPDAAADELERTVRDYGFVGAVVNGHSQGRYLGEPFFEPILERAAGLGVPIYLHPTRPPEAVADTSYGRLAPQVSSMLAIAGWGWHIETATHLLRLILAGGFDRHPQLQVVIGHMGETLPFMIERLDDRMPPTLTGLARPIGDYLRTNVHYTFAGFNFLPVFELLLAEVGIDRIMFSADHPFASMTTARTFLDGLPISDADREQIAHSNAEQLFNL